MKGRIITTLASVVIAISAVAQDKQMTPEVYKQWNKIESSAISTYGNWAHYLVTNENDDSQLHIHNTRTGEELTFARAKKVSLDYEEHFAAFLQTAHPDTIKSYKRKKTKKDKMPKDTLVIVNLKTKLIERIPDILDYKLSNEYGGYIAFRLHKNTLKQDSTLVKDEGKQNGYRLIVKDIRNNNSKSFPYIKDYSWSKKNGNLAIYSSGRDSINCGEMIVFDTKENRSQIIQKDSLTYQYLQFDDEGEKLAYLSKNENEEEEQTDLMTYDVKWSKAKNAINNAKTQLNKEWKISGDFEPYFIDGTGKVVFGTHPQRPKADTTLLEEEKVNVDIWHYKDDLLQTQQLNKKSKEEKRSYKATYDIYSNKLAQIGDTECEEVIINDKSGSDYYIGYDSKGSRQSISWLGHPYYKLYKISGTDGSKQLIADNLDARPRLHPDNRYAIWYVRQDTAWYSYDLQMDKLTQLTEGSFYYELNDMPMHPWSQGIAGYTSDGAVLLNDYYDIWKVPLSDPSKKTNLTKGRASEIAYRYYPIDRDIKILPADTTVLLKAFSHADKKSGYKYMDMSSGKMTDVLYGPFKYSSTIKKAKKSDDILFSKQNWDVFPDLIHSDLTFKNQKTISNANPQQKEYNWGSIELYNWTDHNGEGKHALLAKPDNFDPTKKYPLIVNFYEKSSNGLYNHRAPYAHRSTINYSYYTNKGYIVFNPDIYYVDGYPGESCYAAIMESVDQLLKEGYIDEQRMGLQGHSWGGYQIAYLLTKTDRFRCAESGAPVVNMTSAYGGIRWRTGMSRMFQYERSQSRLGATLWERPDLYLYNSPLFNLDKVETPVLILHNDKDGAVPWYQGIEYFVAMRRLGKPAWLLNYNDEPHWPVKKQNRLDFNIRMEQFFDYYLKDADMPSWMEKGIPAVEKGINDGLDRP